MEQRMNHHRPHVNCTSSGALVILVPGTCWSAIHMNVPFLHSPVKQSTNPWKHSFNPLRSTCLHRILLQRMIHKVGSSPGNCTLARLIYSFLAIYLWIMLCSRLLRPSMIAQWRVSRSSIYHRSRIGNRDVVCHGINGQYNYVDRWDFPYPAIRFMENTPEVMAMREKERGDWRRLSIGEKKTLYRTSFCETFSEMQAPTGEWKSVVAFTLIFVSVGLWLFMWVHTKAYGIAPETFREDRRAAQYFRQEGINNQPFSGNYRPKFVDKYMEQNK